MTVSLWELLSLSLGLVVLTGCGKAPPRTAGARPETARQVIVGRAEVRPMIRAIAVTGTLAARESSTLSAKVAGRLQLLKVDLGSAVREGDLLAQIEPQDYELALQQASAALAQARTALGLPPEGDEDLIDPNEVSAVKTANAVLEEATKNRERIRSLSEAGIASHSELDTVEATFKVARFRHATALEDARTRLAAVTQRRAELDLARKRLADASVRAPFDAVVQSRSADLGEYLAPGTAILELVKTDPLRLRLQVPERECGLVCTGQVVHLLVEGDTNTYSGCIARLSPALDEQNRMLMVEADVPAAGSLRPGRFARAEVIVKEHDAGLSVPANALVTFAGIEKVVGLKESKAVEKVVITGRRGPGWVEVLSGLTSGEVVILDPVGLKTGQPVNVGAPSPTGLEAAKHTQTGRAATN